MMPDLSPLLHLAALGLCLCGVALLLLAAEREGSVLLRREIGLGARQRLRLSGAAVLAMALWLCMRLWQPNFGLLLWIGWLSLSCVAGALAVAWWPGRQRGQRRSPAVARQAPTPAVQARPQPLRMLLALCLVVMPLAFVWMLHVAPQRPVLRADAVSGQVGPWPFVIAQEDRQPPQATPSGVPVKHFVLNFCEGCEAQIAGAWLQLRKPRAADAAGMALQRAGQDREAQLPIAAGAGAQEGLWLTVLGHSGDVFQSVIEISRVSPELARFLQDREDAR